MFVALMLLIYLSELLIKIDFNSWQINEYILCCCYAKNPLINIIKLSTLHYQRYKDTYVIRNYLFMNGLDDITDRKCDLIS